MERTGQLPARRVGGAPPPGSLEPLPQDEIELRDIWTTLRRRRRTIVVTTVAVVGLVLAWTLWVTPIWHATTLIRVEEEQPSLLAAPALETLTGLQGGGSEIETELRILQTRPVAEKVVADLHLALRVESPRTVPRDILFREVALGPDTREDEFEIRPLAGDDARYVLRSTHGGTPDVRREFSAGESVEIPGGSFVLADLARLTDGDGQPVPRRLDIATVSFQEAVEDLMDDVAATRPERDAKLLQVGYRSTDRMLAHAVPNAMARSFIERRIEEQKTNARSTVAFLESQVEDTRRQLEAAEAELQSFREGEGIVAVEAEAEAQVQRLATLQTQRTQLDAERSALRELLGDIQSEGDRPDYRRLASFPTFFENQAVVGMLGSLIQADSSRAALLAQVTPRHPDVVAVEERISELEAQLGAIGRNYLSALDDQVSSIDSVLQGFAAELQRVPQRQIRFARILRQVETLAELYTILQTRLKEAQVQEAIDDSTVRIVEHAIEPLRPASPKPIRNLALAGALGLLLGIVLAFVREYLDRRLHSSDRIEVLFGLPTIARIPALPGLNGRSGSSTALVALGDAGSLGAESFRNLRTNVAFVRGARSAGLVLVTSPATGEGKSLTAANLAVALAQTGHATLLLDGDMRRPVLHEPFGLPLAPGLSDCLLAEEFIDGAIRTTSLDSLHVLPAGTRAPNPAALIDSPQTTRLLATLKERYEAVVVDSPPVLAVTDASVFAPMADGVILVVRAEKTEKDAVEFALQQLRQVDAQILGIVVNNARPEGAYEAYYDQYRGGEASTAVRRLLDRLPGVFS